MGISVFVIFMPVRFSMMKCHPFWARTRSLHIHAHANKLSIYICNWIRLVSILWLGAARSFFFAGGMSNLEFYGRACKPFKRMGNGMQRPKIQKTEGRMAPTDTTTDHHSIYLWFRFWSSFALFHLCAKCLIELSRFVSVKPVSLNSLSPFRSMSLLSHSHSHSFVSFERYTNLFVWYVYLCVMRAAKVYDLQKYFLALMRHCNNE